MQKPAFNPTIKFSAYFIGTSELPSKFLSSRILLNLKHKGNTPNTISLLSHCSAVAHIKTQFHIIPTPNLSKRPLCSGITYLHLLSLHPQINNKSALCLFGLLRNIVPLELTICVVHPISPQYVSVEDKFFYHLLL